MKKGAVITSLKLKLWKYASVAAAVAAAATTAAAAAAVAAAATVAIT